MLTKWNPSLHKSFEPTAITKETYLDVMEIAFNAYSTEAIMSRTKLDGTYLELQSYSRLTSVLACLIASGRKPGQMPLWEHMMATCCQEIHTITPKLGSDKTGASYFHVYGDFSIKEIMLAFKLMSPLITDTLREEWHEELRKVDPYTNFASLIRTPEDAEELHNINIYNMVGEYLRETEGLTETTDYFARHWPVQLTKFDENGMYKDPGCPVLYDLTTRCQIQLMLVQGYRGEFYEEIDMNLRKAGLMTLFMQSSAYEFPYGGRSNQFLFNEALIATNCEFEAARYKAEGNLELAGSFKRCGHLAIQAIRRWLDESPPRHIKNLYVIESGYGTEEYAYYDRYMITMAAFLAIGYMSADDTIVEAPCPAEAGGYVLETSESFHKIFANAAGYSLEIDTRADRKYDATGLGRLHRAQVQTELGLSAPLSGGKEYRLSEHASRVWSAISPGWMGDDGHIQYLSDLSEGLNHELTVLEEQPESVKFTLTYSGACLVGCGAIKETYELGCDGLRYQMELVNPGNHVTGSSFLRVPLLCTNGRDFTSIELQDRQISVALGSSQYLIQLERLDVQQTVRVEDTVYGNRNGEYKLAVITAAGTSLSVSLSLM
jgi:hypothetical protein